MGILGSDRGTEEAWCKWWSNVRLPDLGTGSSERISFVCVYGLSDYVPFSDLQIAADRYRPDGKRNRWLKTEDRERDSRKDRGQRGGNNLASSRLGVLRLTSRLQGIAAASIQLNEGRGFLFSADEGDLLPAGCPSLVQLCMQMSSPVAVLQLPTIQWLHNSFAKESFAISRSLSSPSVSPLSIAADHG